MDRPAATFCLLLTASLVLIPGSAPAQQGLFEGLRKSLDSTFGTVTTTITDASGNTTTTTTNNVYPRLTLNMDAAVVPNFRLSAGGIFEVNMSSAATNGRDTNSTITKVRPFFLLRSTSPIFSPGIGYFRREDRAGMAGSPGAKLVSEDYAAYLGWKPPGGPGSDFQFVRTNTFDDQSAIQDVTKDFGSLVSVYSYGGLGVHYRGTYLNANDRIQRIETRQWSNAGRVSYSSAFIGKRLLLNTTYNINRQDLTTTARGDSGEVAFPVIPFGGLALLSDTPLTATLSPDTVLVDGNLTAASGLDLGSAGPGAESRARNIGLDFLNATEINRLLVWVDRELPVDVATSFTWEIFSSSDNLTWRRETTVSKAPFGPFENRFQIDFSTITARYVKAVTRPLSVVVPDSSRIPHIFVTEVQAFLRQTAGSARGEVVQTTHIFNTDVRMRILSTPALFYEGMYLYNVLGATGRRRDTLSNGVSVNQRFGRIFGVYGRGALEQGTQPEGFRVATLQNATLTVDPLPTLRSSLMYTGQDERIGQTRNDRKGIFVQNNAQVYRGVDVVFGLGWNFTTRETGENSRDRLANVSATIVPRQRVSLTFSFDDTTTKRTGTIRGRSRSHSQRGYVTMAIDPVQTLHLVLAEDVIVTSDEKTRTTHNISANWAPFPDGALQFVFAYNEALRAVEFGKERSLVGGVRWNVSRRSYINITYQRTKSEFVFQTVASRVLSSDVRLFF